MKITAAITRHKNKIKMGHLAGNRFGHPRAATTNGHASASNSTSPRARAQLKSSPSSKKPAAPTSSAPSGFGMRKDNHLLGLALLSGDHESFIERCLGDPDPTVDRGEVLIARQLFKNNNIEEALKHWPGHLDNERRAMVALSKNKKA